MLVLLESEEPKKDHRGRPIRAGIYCTAWKSLAAFGNWLLDRSFSMVYILWPVFLHYFPVQTRPLHSRMQTKLICPDYTIFHGMLVPMMFTQGSTVSGRNDCSSHHQFPPSSISTKIPCTTRPTTPTSPLEKKHALSSFYSSWRHRPCDKKQELPLPSPPAS